MPKIDIFEEHGDRPIDEQSALLSKPSAGFSNKHPGVKDSSHMICDDGLEQRRIIWIMASIWVGTFCAGLDGTIIATLAAPIATSFQSLPQLVWLATGYLIASASVQPLCGKLTDIYSRRAGLLVANLFFTVGNLTCATASQWWIMILGRVLAGMGGGGLTIMANIVISDMVPPSNRGVWQGVGSLCWGLGNGLGGVFGGYVHDVWNWRLAFLLQLPLTVASGTLVFIHMENAIHMNNAKTQQSVKSSIRRIDFLGSLLLVCTLVVLLLGLNSGGSVLPWNHPIIVASFFFGAILLCAFIFVEVKIASEPILPVHLMFNRTVACACLTTWLTNMVTFSLVFYVPIYFSVRGLSATKAGVVLVPFSIASAGGSLLTGIITQRTGKYKFLVILHLVFMLSATITLHRLTLYTPSWIPMVCLGGVGLAYGGILMATLVAVIGAVKRKDQAVVTSLSSVFRSTGSVIGVTIASAISQNVLRAELWNRLGSGKSAQDTFRSIIDSLDAIDRLLSNEQRLVRDSYMRALSAVFLTTVALVLLAFGWGLLIKETKLHTHLSDEDVENQATTTH